MPIEMRNLIVLKCCILLFNLIALTLAYFYLHFYSTIFTVFLLFSHFFLHHGVNNKDDMFFMPLLDV